MTNSYSLSTDPKCPFSRGDPSFDPLMKKIGIRPEDKITVFLTICIFVRLLIAGIALQYYNSNFLPYVYFIVGLITAINLFLKDSDQWWSRKAHIVVSIAIAITASHQIYTGKRDKTIPILLYLDVIIGIITFIILYTYC